MIYNSLLIANRGEIAVRIIKTAHEMGIRCVAVYVDADANAPFVMAADEAVRLPDGGYLDGNLIIDRVNYLDAKNGIIADFETGIVSDDGFGSTDTVSNFERVHGSYHDDDIIR